MCGIIGYTGNANAIPKLIKGLSVLEYRGYDSVGIASFTDNGVRIEKTKGRISDLEAKLREYPFAPSSCAIGHTRWATHGGPSDINSHPHRVGKVTLVHNGIIENYKELKGDLEKEGVIFKSETDTEVGCALISKFYEESGDPYISIKKAIEILKGSYAFAIIFDEHPGEVYTVRLGSPLILSHGKDGSYLASDMTALLPFSKEYCPLEEGKIALLTEEKTYILDGDKKEEVTYQITSMSEESAQKGGYPHFMLKEIHEQSEKLRSALSPRLSQGLPDFSSDKVNDDFFKDIPEIHIVACGSAYHAGIVGSHFLEEEAKVPTRCFLASEYRYRPPVCPKGTLAIFISQSGETADTLAALRYAKNTGLMTLAIVNARETSIAREAHHTLYTNAGPEIAVATTKGYSTQVALLWLVAIKMAWVNGHIDAKKARKDCASLLLDAPRAMEEMLTSKMTKLYNKIAKSLVGREHIFYIGRGIDHALCLEASLKLKEISYIHCEAYAAGELKHGTISLIEPGTPVLAIITEKDLYDKTESNMRECSSRGAVTTLICRDDIVVPTSSYDEKISVTSDSYAATFFAALIAIQYLAYETALLNGCDIDRPRNLAKSVTVE